jgi:hypothetical protein
VRCRVLNDPSPSDIPRVSPTLSSALILPNRFHLWLSPKASTSFTSVHRRIVLLGLQMAFNMLLISKASTTFISVYRRIVLLGLQIAFNMLLISKASTTFISARRQIVLLGLWTAFNMPYWTLNVSHTPIQYSLPVKPGPFNPSVPTRMPPSRSQWSGPGHYLRQMPTSCEQMGSQSCSVSTPTGGLSILSYPLLSTVLASASKVNPQVEYGVEITPPPSSIPEPSQLRFGKRLRKEG